MDYPTCQYTGHIEPYRDCGDCPYLEDCELQAGEEAMSEPIQERKFLGAERYRKGGSEFYSCPRCGGLTVVIGHSYLVTDMGEDVVGQYVNTAKCEYCKSVFAVVYRVPVEDS